MQQGDVFTSSLGRTPADVEEIAGFQEYFLSFNSYSSILIETDFFFWVFDDLNFAVLNPKCFQVTCFITYLIDTASSGLVG
ncbi:MAG: hypothetical protein CM1200mP16_05950 [Nitrospina sp.]|nr:MAG: hypothetical protein CM1200mP16_05950 [Nitrospina sp.]